MITVYALPGQLSPALGPILGAVCDQFLDWRWTFWIVSITSVALQALCFLTVRETYQPVLDRRWEKQQKGGQAQWWPSKEELADTRRKLAINTQRPFKMLATHHIVQLIALSNGLTYGIQMLVMGRGFFVHILRRFGFMQMQTLFVMLLRVLVMFMAVFAVFVVVEPVVPVVRLPLV